MSSNTEAPGSLRRKDVRPFGWRDKIGYAAGDLANDMTFMIQAFFMTVYFVKVIGIDPLHIGALVAAVRVLDAFTDVGMGMIVDRMKPAFDGKFKPWIRRMAVPVALSSALLFQPFIVNWSYGAKLAWMVIFYILWGSVFYTAINIPYGSMASVISDKAEHRAELSVWRSTGAQIAFLAVSASLPALVFEGSQINAQRFGWAAIAMAVLAVFFYAILYFNVEERVVVPRKTKSEGGLSIGQLLGSLVTNRALLAIVAAALLLLLGNLFNGQVASFLYLDYFGNGQLQSLAQVVSILPAFLLVFITAPLVKRYGKTELGIAGVALYTVAMLLNYFLHPPFAVFLALLTVATFGLSIFNFLIWAFIVDVIDYQEVRSGSATTAPSTPSTPGPASSVRRVPRCWAASGCRPSATRRRPRSSPPRPSTASGRCSTSSPRCSCWPPC